MVAIGRPVTAQPVDPRDLEGVWANITVTPLERPADLAGTPVFTLDEARAWETSTVERIQKQGIEGRISPDFTDDWRDLGAVVPSLRTSLIIDPPDGRIPFTAAARAAQLSAGAPKSYDDPEQFAPGERCLVWQEGPPMVPSGITGYLQIVQTDDRVLIFTEMVHTARIVRLDQPHLPPQIRQWSGDSVGRWEGNTLVVDTTNFTAKTAFRGATAALHVTERFTRTGADTIAYQFTVDDPATFVRPWTAETVFTPSRGQLYEYACHEANYSLEYSLRGARAAESQKP